MDNGFDRCSKKKTRGETGQLPERSRERDIRRRTIAYKRWSKLHGRKHSDSARTIGISPRTINYWESDWHLSRLEIRSLGRPAGRSSVETRIKLFEVLNDLGPMTGVPSLHGMFPDLPRREVEHLLAQYRIMHVEENKILVHNLNWKKPGLTWAMDFTEPDLPIDGVYPYVFAVRDLASHFCLMWIAAFRQTARVVYNALLLLFTAFGVPLMIKHDGGSEFKAEAAKLLADKGVTRLVSPPDMPTYNGSIEAGIGNITTYTHFESAKRNRPCNWSVEDLEAARMRTNEIARPQGYPGPTPEEIWKEREFVTPEKRCEFRSTLTIARESIKLDLGFEPYDELDRKIEAYIERQSVSRACVAHGLLDIRRRRISQPNIAKKCANFMR